MQNLSTVFKNSRFVVLSSLVCVFLSPLLADQIAFKNGDRITGSVVKKDGKNLTIKTDQFGVVTTSWDLVESIRTDKPVNVVLQDGRKAQGTLAPTDGGVEVATPTERLSVKPAEIAVIRDADEQKAYERLESPGWGELWAGTVSVGFTGTSGNARTLTFTTAVNAARVVKTGRTSIYFNTIKASALVNGKNADTAQAIRGGIGYDRNVRPRLFATSFNDWEYDKFQNLDLRFVAGGGLGFHAAKRERSQLDLLGGVDYNHSSFSTPLTTNSAELFWGDEYSLKLGPAASLVQSYRMFNDLTNSGSYRVNFDVSASTKLSKWLNWNVSASDRYLNHPAPNRKTNDILYTTGLGITFAK
jgi:hypothetical protein